MLSIDKQNNISLTHGDTLTLTVALTKDGQTYQPEPTDAIRFALSIGYVGDKEYQLIMTKNVPIDSLTFTLSAEETEALEMRKYVYDIQITHADGAVDTVIIGRLNITGEAE